MWLCETGGVKPVSSKISDLCEISDLLLFFSYFASQNKEIKSGNYFFNTCAEWRICASYVQMHRVRNDAYRPMRHSIEYAWCGLTCINANATIFHVLVYLERNFTQMFFISRHANPENFIEIDQKLFELWCLVANRLARPRPEVSGLSNFAIQIQSWIFQTQSKSNHSPKRLKKLKSKSR